MKRLVTMLDEIVKDWGRRPEILFVDDDQDLVRVGCDFLRRLDCEPTGETNSVNAVQRYTEKFYADTTRRPYDLIFLDLRMPVMDGVDVLKEIRRLSLNQPVTLMTGYAHQFNWDELSALGYVGLILKPFSTDELDTVLNAHNLRFNEVQRQS